MSTRNVIIGAIVLVVVATATATGILYLQGSKPDVIDHADLATVLVSKSDIHLDQSFDPLIDDGVIVEIDVPRYALVAEALTDIDQVRGRTAISLIRKNEQILAVDVVQLDVSA